MAVPGGGSDGETVLERADAAAGKKGLRMISRRTGYSNDVRDAAAAHARGEYLLFMDGHTVAKPEQISTLIKVAERSRADVLPLFWIFTPATGRPIAISLGCRPFLGAAVISGIFHNYYGQGGIFIRKEALLRVGGFAADDWRPCETGNSWPRSRFRACALRWCQNRWRGIGSTMSQASKATQQRRWRRDSPAAALSAGDAARFPRPAQNVVNP